MKIEDQIKLPSDYDPHFKHTSNKAFMKKLRTYIHEQVLLSHRYLFVNKKGSKTRAMCSHCGHQSILGKVPKQHTLQNCESCGSRLQVRNTKFASYQAGSYVEFIYFARSSKSKDIIVAYQFGVRRRIGDNYDSFEEIKVEDRIDERARFYFEIGGTNRLMIYSQWQEEWHFASSIHKPNSAQNYFRGFDDEQLISVVSKVDAYKYFPKHLVRTCDSFNLLDLYTKYPNIELLLNIGIEKPIFEKTTTLHKTFNTINWHGKTIQKILKLNKNEIIFFKSETQCKFQDLYVLQTLKKYGLNYENEFKSLLELSEGVRDISELHKLVRKDKPSRMVKYLKNQREKAPRTYWSFNMVVRDFLDMLSDMESLSIEANKRTIYPKDLNRHHGNLSAQVKVVIDEQKEQLIKQRAEKLSKFNLTKGDFVIFPAESTEDLIKESKELHHCVKGYADNYALGKTNIFFMREKDKTDQPLYTIEINNEMKLRQCRGKYNQSLEQGSEAEKVLGVFLKNLKTKRSVTHERI